MPGRGYTATDDELTPAGRRKRRSERCRAATGLLYSELVALVAIVAHYRTFGRPVTRAKLSEFLQREEELTCESQPSSLRKQRLIEPRRKSTAIGWVPTASGSTKVGAWRRAPVGQREEPRPSFDDSGLVPA